jgi:hypothetical protein
MPMEHGLAPHGGSATFYGEPRLLEQRKTAQRPKGVKPEIRWPANTDESPKALTAPPPRRGIFGSRHAGHPYRSWQVHRSPA